MSTLVGAVGTGLYVMHYLSNASGRVAYATGATSIRLFTC